jgi:hypothetical protein
MQSFLLRLRQTAMRLPNSLPAMREVQEVRVQAPETTIATDQFAAVGLGRYLHPAHIANLRCLHRKVDE